MSSVLIVYVSLYVFLSLMASSLLFVNVDTIELIEARPHQAHGGSSFEAVDSRPFVATTAPIDALTDSRVVRDSGTDTPTRTTSNLRLPRIWAVRLLKGLR